MKVDNELLKRLENLSNLEIADNKREEIIAQLGEIVSFVDNLAELDTTDIDATFSMTQDATPLREDTPMCDSSINEMILKNAPQSEENFFVVPKIIE